MSETDKKYKYTKNLLKIAIETSGYINKDIAVKAGLSGKSVALVSAWRNGRKNATERQMAYFIKEYEHLLKQTMHHLFYSVSLENGVEVPVFVKLSGEIIFKYQVKIARKNNYLRNVKDFSSFRIIVLKDSNHFHLLYQHRAGLLEVEELEHNGAKRVVFSNLTTGRLVYSDNESGNWYCHRVERALAFDDIVSSIQSFCQSLISGDNIIDSVASRKFGQVDGNSKFFSSGGVFPLELAFYQKMLSLNLHSKHFPF